MGCSTLKAAAMMYLAEFTNKITGQTRKIQFEADDLETASDLATKMLTKMVRETGLYWSVNVDNND
jgi:hypothetical protein